MVHRWTISKRFMAQMAAGLFAAPLVQAQQARQAQQAQQAQRAQRADKLPRIGLIANAPAPNPTYAPNLETLLTALRALGWVDGRNLIVETSYAGPNPQRQREIAAELKALPVALIMAAGTTSIRSARDGAPGLPIVMINAGDSLGAGLVASLARPGGD